MSESTVSILIAAAILVVLALFIPCMELLARLFRRNRQKQGAADETRPARSYQRSVAQRHLSCADLADMEATINFPSPSITNWSVEQRWKARRLKK